VAKSIFYTKTPPRATFEKTSEGSAKFYNVKNNVTFTELLPFRVKFINIGVAAYGPGNAAPIGIAIIGLNNYVM
jgi:hypothetical protein